MASDEKFSAEPRLRRRQRGGGREVVDVSERGGEEYGGVEVEEKERNEQREKE